MVCFMLYMVLTKDSIVVTPWFMNLLLTLKAMYMYILSVPSACVEH